MADEYVVWIVDDDESIRWAVDGLLRSVGLRTHACASVEEFLQSAILETTGCLVLDVRMSGMGGLALQHWLAGGGYRIPIIILTAHGDGETRRRALEAGALAFLPKPFDEEVLLATVSTALAKRAWPDSSRGGKC